MPPDDETWNSMTQGERNDWVKSEAAMVMHQLEFIQAGLAVRRAGLIWFLPLCHDAYGENI